MGQLQKSTPENILCEVCNRNVEIVTQCDHVHSFKNLTLAVHVTLEEAAV